MRVADKISVIGGGACENSDWTGSSRGGWGIVSYGAVPKSMQRFLASTGTYASRFSSACHRHVPSRLNACHGAINILQTTTISPPRHRAFTSFPRAMSSDDGENFDLDDVSGSDSDGYAPAPKKVRARRRVREQN